MLTIIGLQAPERLLGHVREWGVYHACDQQRAGFGGYPNRIHLETFYSTRRLLIANRPAGRVPRTHAQELAIIGQWVSERPPGHMHRWGVSHDPSPARRLTSESTQTAYTWRLSITRHRLLIASLKTWPLALTHGAMREGIHKGRA